MFTRTKQRRERFKYGLVTFAASLMMGAVMAPAALQAQNVTFAGVETVAASGLGTVYGLAQDQAGNLYVSVPDLTGTTAGLVLKIPSGTNTPVRLPGSWYQPEGLYLDQTGTLWVADSAQLNIQKISPTGSVSPFASTLNPLPVSVTLDSAGNVYACDIATSQLDEFSPSGKLLNFLGLFATMCSSATVSPGNVVYIAYPGSGLLNNAADCCNVTFSGLDLTDVKMDGAGNIWVVARGSGTIREQTPPASRRLSKPDSVGPSIC